MQTFILHLGCHVIDFGGPKDLRNGCLTGLVRRCDACHSKTIIVTVHEKQVRVIPLLALLIVIEGQMGMFVAVSPSLLHVF